MRPIRIYGNSIFKRIRALASILGCCDTLWKDSVIWDDDCEWKEPDCDGVTWVNSEVWNNECSWP